MLPLQPYANGSEGANRRWVRQDFRMRRRLFLEEVCVCVCAACMIVFGSVHMFFCVRCMCEVTETCPS